MYEEDRPFRSFTTKLQHGSDYIKTKIDYDKEYDRLEKNSIYTRSNIPIDKRTYDTPSSKYRDGYTPYYDYYRKVNSEYTYYTAPTNNLSSYSSSQSKYDRSPRGCT